MNSNDTSEEFRWQVMKTMLEEFPELREKVKSYLAKSKSQEPINDVLTRKQP
jgi:hypothetical protein